MGKSKKIRIAAAVLAAVALLFVIGSLGSTHQSPLVADLQLDDPKTADSSEDITAVVDSQSRRLLILDKNYQVSASVRIDSSDTPIEAVTDVCVSGDEIYLAGAVYGDTGDYPSKTYVLKYNKHGKSLGTVLKYESTDEATYSVESLNSEEDGALAVVNYDFNDEERDGPEFSVVRISGNKLEPVESLSFTAYATYDITYNAAAGDFVAINMLGNLTDDGELLSESAYPEAKFTSVTLSDDGTVYAYDIASGNVVRLTGDGIEPLFEADTVERLHVNGNVLTATSPSSDSMQVYFLDGTGLVHVGPDVPISPLLRVQSILFWLSIVYVLALIIVFLARRAYRLVKEGRAERIGAVIGSVAVVIVIAVAVGYFTNASYQESLETRSREINAFADYLSSWSDDLSESMEAADNRESYRGSSEEISETIRYLATIDDELSTFANAANGNDIDLYFALYGKDDKGVFKVYDSSLEHVMGIPAPQDENFEAVEEAFEGECSTDMFSGQTLRDSTIFRLVPIPDSDGEGTVGVIELGSRMKILQSDTMGNQYQNVLAFFIIIFVVYLAYSELRASATCFLERHDLLKRRPDDALAMLSRPFCLGVSFIQAVDAVMTVLIARSMYSADLPYGSFLVALPAVAMGIGLVIGGAVYASLVSRVSLRKLCVGTSVILLVFAVATVNIVLLGNLTVYCVAKLLLAIPVGMLYSLSYALPRIAGSKEVGASAGNGCVFAETSALALGTIVSGYIAQVLGFAWVYVLMALATLILLIACFNLFPRGFTLTEERASGTEVAADFFKSVFNRKTLPLVLLVILPAALANGFNTFLFPLYSADAGLSTSSINNMFVLGQLVVYVLITTLIMLRSRRGLWRTIVIATALLGIVLLLLSFNRTIVWAIVAIALIALFCKTTEGWKVVWLRVNDEEGFAPGVGTATMLSVRSIVLVFQPLILGLFLSAGGEFAVIAVGVICVVAALLFWLATRHSTLADRR